MEELIGISKVVITYFVAVNHVDRLERNQFKRTNLRQSPEDLSWPLGPSLLS